MTGRERFVLGALAAGAIAEAVFASPSVAAAAGLGPSFSASGIHYRIEPTTGASYGISSVSFSLQATDPEDVSAWFNRRRPPADMTYGCSQGGSIWICTEPVGSPEQDVEGATSLHIRVDGVSSQSGGGTSTGPASGGGGTTSSGGAVGTSPGSGGTAPGTGTGSGDGGGASVGSPPGISTAVGGSVGNAPTIFGATLPFTGLELLRLVVYALSACIGGIALTAWSRRRA